MCIKLLTYHHQICTTVHLLWMHQLTIHLQFDLFFGVPGVKTLKSNFRATMLAQIKKKNKITHQTLHTDPHQKPNYNLIIL